MNRRGHGGSLSNTPITAPSLASVPRCSSPSTAPRVVFFGMRCAFSVPPLAALLDAGFDVQAVLLPGQRETAEAGMGDHAVVALARGASIPVLEMADRHGSEGVRAIAAHRPDVVVVACFPWRLPRTALDAPPLGCLNVHPSLLPRGRGPEPVFWTLRRGERRTGATVHLMDAGLDTGPIVAQAGWDVPEGVRAPALERRLAELGGRLLVAAIPGLAAGSLTPVAQDDALARSAPVPTAADFGVPTNLPARWAYNFVRGVAPLGGPLTLLVGATGERLPVRDAVDYDPEGTLDQPLVRDGETLLVRCKPGVVRLVVGESGD